jgi:hypothetical protein
MVLSIYVPVDSGCGVVGGAVEARAALQMATSEGKCTLLCGDFNSDLLVDDSNFMS